MSKEKAGNKKTKVNNKTLKKALKETPNKKGASFGAEKKSNSKVIAKTKKVIKKEEPKKKGAVKTKTAGKKENVKRDTTKTVSTKKAVVTKPLTNTKPLVKNTIDRKELIKRLKIVAASSKESDNNKKKNNKTKKEFSTSVKKKANVKNVSTKPVDSKKKDTIKTKPANKKETIKKTPTKKAEINKQIAKKTNDKKVVVEKETTKKPKKVTREVKTKTVKEKNTTDKSLKSKADLKKIETKNHKTVSKKIVQTNSVDKTKKVAGKKTSTKIEKDVKQVAVDAKKLQANKTKTSSKSTKKASVKKESEKTKIKESIKVKQVEEKKPKQKKTVSKKNVDKPSLKETKEELLSEITFKEEKIVEIHKDNNDEITSLPEEVLFDVQEKVKITFIEKIKTFLKELFSFFFNKKIKDEVDEIYPPKFDSVYDAIEYESNLIISLMDPSMKPEPIIEEEPEIIEIVKENKSLITLIKEFFTKLFKLRNITSSQVDTEEDEIYPPKFDSVYDAIEYESNLIISLMDPSMKPEPIIEEDKIEVIEELKEKKSLLTIIKEFFTRIFKLENKVSVQIDTEEINEVYPPKFDSVYDAIEYESNLIISLMDPSMKPEPIVEVVEEETKILEEISVKEDKKTLFNSIKMFFSKPKKNEVKVLEETKVEEITEILPEENKLEESVVETEQIIDGALLEETVNTVEVIDEIVIESSIEDKKENLFFKIVKDYYKTALFGILLGFLVFDLALKFMPKETTVYKFSEINSQYIENEYTLEVPSDWVYFDDYPGFLTKDKKKLEFKMSFSAGEMDDEKFAKLLEELRSTHEIRIDNVNGIDVYGFMNETEGTDKYSYYVAYFDGICTIMNIQNENYSKGLDIIGTFK